MININSPKNISDLQKINFKKIKIIGTCNNIYCFAPMTNLDRIKYKYKCPKCNLEQTKQEIGPIINKTNY